MPKQCGLVTGGRLNLRERNSIASTSILLIPNETTLLVEDYNEGWYAAIYGKLSGYVMKQYVMLQSRDTDVILP